MFDSKMTIEGFDEEILAAIKSEEVRQEEHIELIASENYASPRVMAAQGTALTNKYAEGYPGKRYYGGCEYVDQAEELAINRIKKLFGADYARGSRVLVRAYMLWVRSSGFVLSSYCSLDRVS